MCVGVHSGLHHFARVEQLEVERAREVRVVEPQLALPHGVLVLPKEWQALRDEALQGQQRVVACDGPAKAGQVAGMLCELGVDQGHHLLGDGVGCKALRGRDGRWALFAKGGAVVGIEVPLPAHGFAVDHQDAGFLAQGAVPVFKPQLFAAFGVFGKFTHGAEEVQVVAQLQGQVMLTCHGAQVLQHTPFTGGGEHQGLGFELFNGAAQSIGQGVGCVGCIQRGVVQRPALGAQGLREVAHGAQEDGGALFGRGNVGGLLHHLGHPHRVAAGVKVVQGGGVEVELVAQHDHQMAQRSWAHGSVFFWARQASEQYSTWSQFLAQALRQVMGR